MALLRAHRAEQDRERALAQQLWYDEGWVFATSAGQPINPRTDYDEWKRLLKEAGLRDARLHDARHTAAIVLLVLRQPTPTVMSLMGWSSESMAARYQHVTDALRSQVASQVGELIWDSAAKDDDQAPLMVHRGSLAAVLAAVEECIAGHHGSTGPRTDLLAALADLRAALPPSSGPVETSNETKTETRRADRRMNANNPLSGIAGQQRWRWDLNPRRGCPLTRFRVLRIAVHHRPPVFVTSADRMPTVAGERLRTGVNEPETEPRAWRRGAAADRVLTWSGLWPSAGTDGRCPGVSRIMGPARTRAARGTGY